MYDCHEESHFEASNLRQQKNTVLKRQLIRLLPNCLSNNLDIKINGSWRRFDSLPRLESPEGDRGRG